MIAPKKLARLNAGLAPEDETYDQAAYTGHLRHDPTYAERWFAFEMEWDDALPEPATPVRWHPQIERMARWGVG